MSKEEKIVIIPPIVDYGLLKQLPQQMAEQFAKNGYSVIFCNVTQNTVIHRVNDNLIITGNFKQILEDCKSGRLKPKIVYNTWAGNHEFIDTLKPEINIWHDCDSFDEWKPFEKDMARKSDVIFCTAQKIYSKRKRSKDNVYLLRNACDSTLIDNTEGKTEKVTNIGKRTFGFVGACGGWVSTYLMKNVAKKYPVVFVGTEFGKAKPPNVIDLGLQPHALLAKYYNSLDFGLIPFNTKLDVTQNANPIKMWEYLGCGVPVLATRWIETIQEDLDGVVFTSKDEMDYVKVADDLYSMDDDELSALRKKCVDVARENTWEKRFEIVKEVIK